MVTIADASDAAQKEFDLLGQLRDQIQNQKRGLMQKLLTGQIPVRGTRIALESPNTIRDKTYYWTFADSDFVVVLWAL